MLQEQKTGLSSMANCKDTVTEFNFFLFLCLQEEKKKNNAVKTGRDSCVLLGPLICVLII